MRLLLTTDTVGGVWTFTQELTTELLRRGHSVALLSFGKRPSDDQNRWVLARARRYKGRFFHLYRDVPLEWMDDNADTWYFGEGAILEMFEAAPFEIDLIHANQFPWAAMNLGYPVVTTAHSDIRSWAEACEPRGLEAGEWLDTCTELVQVGLERTDVLTAPSQWLADAFCRLWEYPGPVAVVPNGRDLTAALQRAQPVTDRVLRAVSAARVWDVAKGLRNLAAVKLPMPLLIAGAVEVDYHPAAAPKLPPGATCLGRLDERRLIDLFLSSAVYLLASLYEPFGLSAVEAALCGCAVLARDLPSLREVWGDDALFFADNAELERQLERLASDADLLADRQQRSRARAEQYTASRMANGYLEQYRRAFDDAEAYGDLEVDFEPLPPEQWESRYER